MLFYVIEQSQMLRRAWETVIKSAGHDVYSTDQVGDFRYIAEDMQPDAFICCSETLNRELEQFLSVYNSSDILAKSAIFLVGDTLDGLSVKNVFDKPFNPIDTFNSVLDNLKMENS